MGAAGLVARHVTTRSPRAPRYRREPPPCASSPMQYSHTIRKIMSRQRFIELATDLCALAQLPEPERLLEGNAIEVNGVDFYLGYDEETAPGQLVVYCDFGAPPKERLLDVYEALLEANMVVYGNNSPAFMLSPDKRVAFGYQ